MATFLERDLQVQLPLPVCFSDSGDEDADELTTDEARRMILNARDAGVTDIVVSGGEPFLRGDLFELLVYMTDLGISARIASNGSLLDADLCRRLRRETATKAFQISLDRWTATCTKNARGPGDDA